MKANAIRLLLLTAVFAVVLGAPARSEATLLCPTDVCWALQNQCIAEGGNHDYLGFETATGLLCQDDSGMTWELHYLDCCKLPGCNPLVWRKYCKA
jgi:hypothetical protein